MDFFDDKLALFLDKDILQETVDACVDKGIDLAEVRWFTQPENRIVLAKQMLSGQYHIAPPHIIQIPKRDSSEMRKVYHVKGQVKWSLRGKLTFPDIKIKY